MLEELIAYWMSLPEVEEGMPFGADVLVYKVCGKMFALTDPQRVPTAVNLKCEPDRALELRDQYEAVKPGYHMSKKHWNTVEIDGGIPDALIKEMSLDSYQLVVKGLKKTDRERLG